MWAVNYNGDSFAKYIVTFFPEQYMHIHGQLYSVLFANRQGRCAIGLRRENHDEYQDGDYDWETYFGKFRSLGWQKNIMPDTDPKVREIIESPPIKKILYDYLWEYRYILIQDIFERFK